MHSYILISIIWYIRISNKRKKNYCPYFRSSIPEESSETMSSDIGQNGASPGMRRGSLQPGANMFQKEGMKSRGNLLSTVNGNFTAATRSGLLSNSGMKF